MANKQPRKSTSDTASGDEPKVEPSLWPNPPVCSDARGLRSLIEAYLNTELADDPGRTWRHKLVETLLKQALDGDLRILQELWTRLDGKPGAGETAAREPLSVTDHMAREILGQDRPVEDEDQAADDGDGDTNDDA